MNHPFIGIAEFSGSIAEKYMSVMIVQVVSLPGFPVNLLKYSCKCWYKKTFCSPINAPPSFHALWPWTVYTPVHQLGVAGPILPLFWTYIVKRLKSLCFKDFGEINWYIWRPSALKWPHQEETQVNQEKKPLRTRAKGLSHPYNSDSHCPRPMTPVELLQPFQLFKLAKVTRGGYRQAVPMEHISANNAATATKDTRSGEHCFAATGLRTRRMEEKRAEGKAGRICQPSWNN